MAIHCHIIVTPVTSCHKCDIVTKIVCITYGSAIITYAPAIITYGPAIFPYGSSILTYGPAIITYGSAILKVAGPFFRKQCKMKI